MVKYNPSRRLDAVSEADRMQKNVGYGIPKMEKHPRYTGYVWRKCYGRARCNVFTATWYDGIGADAPQMVISLRYQRKRCAVEAVDSAAEGARRPPLKPGG